MKYLKYLVISPFLGHLTKIFKKNVFNILFKARKYAKLKKFQELIKSFHKLTLNGLTSRNKILVQSCKKR